MYGPRSAGNFRRVRGPGARPRETSEPRPRFALPEERRPENPPTDGQPPTQGRQSSSDPPRDHSSEPPDSGPSPPGDDPSLRSPARAGILRPLGQSGGGHKSPTFDQRHSDFPSANRTRISVLKSNQTPLPESVPKRHQRRAIAPAAPMLQSMHPTPAARSP